MFRALPVALCLVAGTPFPATTAIDGETEIRGDTFEGEEPEEQLWLRQTLRHVASLSARVSLRMTPVLEWDSHGDIDRDDLYDGDDRSLKRTLLRFEDLTLRIDLGAVDLEVGRQRITWRRTDGVNPVDNLTPRDWTDPVHEVRLSPWAVRAGFERGRWTADLALLPAAYFPSRLPALGGRWLPLETRSVTNPLYPALGPPRLDVLLEWADAEFPPATLDNLQWGARGGYRGSRGEWSASLFRGFDDAPRVGTEPGMADFGRGVVPVRLIRRFPEILVSGLDGVLLAGRWAFRAEAGYFHFPERLDDGFLLYEVEAEWSRGAWTAILGYAGFAGEEQARIERGAPGLTREMDGGALAGAEITAALDQGALPAIFLRLARFQLTGWELGLQGVLGTDEGDFLARLSGSWPASDRIRLGAEVDLLAGSAGTFFGRWRDADRLRVFLRAAF